MKTTVAIVIVIALVAMIGCSTSPTSVQQKSDTTIVKSDSVTVIINPIRTCSYDTNVYNNGFPISYCSNRRDHVTYYDDSLVVYVGNPKRVATKVSAKKLDTIRLINDNISIPYDDWMMSGDGVNGPWFMQDCLSEDDMVDSTRTMLETTWSVSEKIAYDNNVIRSICK
jgi:hypothetical protein